MNKATLGSPLSLWTPAYTAPMRLTDHEREVIRAATARYAGHGARVMLFGSRTRPDRKGGDIDLLVELPHQAPDRLRLSLQIGADIERQLGLQKIDVLVAGTDTPDSPILTAARSQAIQL